MSKQTLDNPAPARKNWLLYSVLVTLGGLVIIAWSVYENSSTLFDHNGPSSPDQHEELSVVESVVVAECLVLAMLVAVLLRKAWRQDRGLIGRSWRLPLTLVSSTPIILALLAGAFAISEIIN